MTLWITLVWIRNLYQYIDWHNVKALLRKQIYVMQLASKFIRLPAVRAKPNKWHMQLTGSGSDRPPADSSSVKKECATSSSASGIRNRLGMDLPPERFALANKLTRRSFVPCQSSTASSTCNHGRHKASSITELRQPCGAEPRLAFYKLFTREKARSASAEETLLHRAIFITARVLLSKNLSQNPSVVSLR